MPLAVRKLPEQFDGHTVSEHCGCPQPFTVTFEAALRLVGDWGHRSICRDRPEFIPLGRALMANLAPLFVGRACQNLGVRLGQLTRFQQRCPPRGTDAGRPQREYQRRAGGNEPSSSSMPSGPRNTWRMLTCAPAIWRGPGGARPATQIGAVTVPPIASADRATFVAGAAHSPAAGPQRAAGTVSVPAGPRFLRPFVLPRLLWFQRVTHQWSPNICQANSP